jgi:hypothetical protein
MFNKDAIICFHTFLIHYYCIWGMEPVGIEDRLHVTLKNVFICLELVIQIGTGQFRGH